MAHALGAGDRPVVDGVAVRAPRADGRGGWRVDGVAAPHLDGCLDVDLESSSLTNAFPVNRLGLGPAERADAPAAMCARSTSPSSASNSATSESTTAHGARYDYTSPAFDFRCELAYDAAGLVLDYPGIASRAA